MKYHKLIIRLHPTVCLFSFLIFFISSCTKEYVTNEYITNEYITNEYVTNNDYVYEKEYYSFILNKQEEITKDIMPAYLQPGDSVAICATSNSITQQEMQNGVSVLESWGLKVLPADNLYDKDVRYAGTLAQRIDGLQKLIDNQHIKAIIAARGGYGCHQLFPFVDLAPLEDYPKWIVGYSDLTALHAAVNNMGIQTIHGPMAGSFGNAVNTSDLKKALFGEKTSIAISTNENCIQGEAEGRLVGGNLTTFYALAGTVIDLNVKGAILFFEDTGEANYNVDRMLTNLRLSGKLDAVKGIVVGSFTSMSQGQDLPLEQIIMNNVKDLGIPVMYGLQAGHGSPNYSLYMGRQVKLSVTSTEATITFE